MTALHSTKHGQVHINETILVLFMVIIIILIGITVYYKLSLSSLQQLGEDLSERDASILLAKAATLPELRCDHDECLDTAKFLPFQRLAQHDTYYRQALGNKKIAITQLYPPTTPAPCDILHTSQADYPDTCDTWTLYEHNPAREPPRILSTIVSLYFPETKEYRIGRLTIEHYGSI